MTGARPSSVLLVEDDPAWAGLTREAFAEVAPDVRVEVVSDGDAAIARIKEPDAPEVVLLDLNMPGTDGRDVLRAVQEEPPGRRDVVVLSASMSVDDRALAADLGATAYVNKPTTFGALCRLADAVLSGTLEEQPEGSPAAEPGRNGDEGPSITRLRLAVVPGHDPALARRLADAGFDVRVVRTTDELGAAGAVDCVLLDLDAPGVRRTTAVHQALEQVPGVPVVVVLGTATAASELAVLAAGASDVVPQAEASQEVLVRTVRFAVERATLVAALEEQRRFLEAVIDDVATGIVACDAQGRLRVVNAAAARLHGRELEEGLRPPEWPEAYKMVSLETGEPLTPGEVPLVRALAGEMVVDAELGIQGPDGEVRRCSVRGRPLRGARSELIGAVVVFDDVTERHRAEAALLRQALLDPLTGLPNRNLGLDRLQHSLARALREGESTAVLFVDLDRFKEVNDTEGHEAGDRVLRQVADRLRTAIRPGDTVARLGGDEFLVIAEGVYGEAAARHLAERVHASLGDLTASIGVALVRNGMAADEVVRRADVAMYRAKRRGGATTELWVAPSASPSAS